MHRSPEVMRPKTKVSVALQRLDGVVLEGEMFASGAERIIDVLNSERPFFPLEVSKGRLLLVNKSSVAYIEPYDEGWMVDV